MDIAGSRSVQVFLHADILDLGSVVATLAPEVVSSCGCAVSAMLFNNGLISASTARRLRNASVFYSSAVVIASSLVVELAGMLAGPALQLLQTIVPAGCGLGFLIVNLALNEICVLDDVTYVPILVKPSSMLFPTLLPIQSKFWFIEKRPKHAVVARNSLHLFQKEVARASTLYKSEAQESQSVNALTTQNQPKNETLMNVALAIVFAIASSYYAFAKREAKNGMEVHLAQLRSPSYVPRPIFLPNPFQALGPRKLVPLAQNSRLTEKRTRALKSGKRVSAMWSLQPRPLTPRMRWIIAASVLIALQLSQPQDGLVG